MKLTLSFCLFLCLFELISCTGLIGKLIHANSQSHESNNDHNNQNQHQPHPDPHNNNMNPNTNNNSKSPGGQASGSGQQQNNQQQALSSAQQHLQQAGQQHHNEISQQAHHEIHTHDQKSSSSDKSKGKGSNDPNNNNKGNKKKGRCPPPSSIVGTCQYVDGVNCHNDTECKGHKKCCREGCNKICKKPMKPSIPLDLDTLEFGWNRWKKSWNWPQVNTDYSEWMGERLNNLWKMVTTDGDENTKSGLNNSGMRKSSNKT